MNEAPLCFYNLKDEMFSRVKDRFISFIWKLESLGAYEELVANFFQTQVSSGTGCSIWCWCWCSIWCSTCSKTRLNLLLSLSRNVPSLGE